MGKTHSTYGIYSWSIHDLLITYNSTVVGYQHPEQSTWGWM